MDFCYRNETRLYGQLVRLLKFAASALISGLIDVASDRTLQFHFDVANVDTVKRSLASLIQSAEREQVCSTLLSTSIEYTATEDDAHLTRQVVSDMMSRLQTIQQDLESQRPAIGMLLELYRAVAKTGQSVLSVSTCRSITEIPVFGNTRSDYGQSDN